MQVIELYSMGDFLNNINGCRVGSIIIENGTHYNIMRKSAGLVNSRTPHIRLRCFAKKSR